MPTKIYDFDDDSEWTLDAFTEISGGKLRLKSDSTWPSQSYQDTYDTPAEYNYDTAEVEVVGGVVKMKKGWKHSESFVANLNSKDADYSKSGISLVGVLTADAEIDTTEKKFGAASLNDAGSGTAQELQYSTAGKAIFGLGGTKGSISMWVRLNTLTNSGHRHAIEISASSGNGSRIQYYYPSGQINKINIVIHNSGGGSSFVKSNHNAGLIANQWVYTVLTFDLDASTPVQDRHVEYFTDGVSRWRYQDLADFSRVDSSVERITLMNVSLVDITFDGRIDDLCLHDDIIDGTYVPNAERAEWYPLSAQEITRIPGTDFQSGVPLGVFSYDTFTEAVTTPALTSVEYLVSTDGGTSYLYWNGSIWAIASGTWNTAAEINTGFPSLGTSETDLTWKIRLTTTDSDETPELDTNTVEYTALIYWPEAVLKTSESFGFSAFTSSVAIKTEPPNTAINCRITNNSGYTWKYWDGSAFTDTTTLWGSLTDTVANIALLTFGEFLIKLQLTTSEEFTTPELDTLTFTFVDPVIDPIERIYDQEMVVDWTLESDIGYVYDANLAQFLDGEIRLKDLGGGSYASAATVYSPIWTPSKSVSEYVRIDIDKSENSGESIEVLVQVSNDNGDNWGIYPPYYNDEQWQGIESGVFLDIAFLKHIIQPNGKGADRVKFLFILQGPGTSTPIIKLTRLTAVAILGWTPTYISRADIAALANVDIGIIDNVTHRMAEEWVSSQLKRKGLIVADHTDNPLAEQAAAFKTLCFLAGTGRVSQFVPGSVRAASSDGMAVSYDGTVEGNLDHEYTAGTWCTMAGQTIEQLVRAERVTEGSMRKRSVNMAAGNGVDQDIERGKYSDPRRFHNWRPM